jgi:hypothetical protein
MTITTINELIQFLKHLESKKIYYSLTRYLEDSLSIAVVVPGERWEIDINQRNEIQIEIFKSNGEIYNSSMLQILFDKFSD